MIELVKLFEGQKGCAVGGSFEKRSGRRILRCEDHPINAMIVEGLLEKQGMTVDTAENGQQGAEMFAKSAQGLYSAVLMDINMPVMNGLEAAEAIRALDRCDAKTVPIIAMTADNGEEEAQKALAAVMNGFAVKPVDPQKLFELLAQLFEVQ